MHLNPFCSLTCGKSDGFGFAPSPPLRGERAGVRGKELAPELSIL